MGLFEFLFERRNPGPIGDIEVAGGQQGDPKWLPVRVLLSGTALVACVYLVFQSTPDPSNRGLMLAAWLVYLVAGYWIRPRPDYRNVGWGRTPFDNPFRWSDDANRLLMFLMIVLYPARFVAQTLVDVARFLRR